MRIQMQEYEDTRIIQQYEDTYTFCSMQIHVRTHIHLQ
jgi:hypothetical protein